MPPAVPFAPFTDENRKKIPRKEKEKRVMAIHHPNSIILKIDGQEISMKPLFDILVTKFDLELTISYSMTY